ncbi:mitochondrial ubiquitin ligase activator of NFKB 1 [Takifugu rubripes]|uniref:RING-type E3 ubiquitin transferase n=1 Tax=Takifugu rubripes TaxID=31033 RepID=H2SZQ4_TAKRU|nr:mitochondrial ubiquitin ligase activator of NFKB 1 [Takifugu rubripes]XP_011617325.2 mitochondrial ubiquitin ligase activator of NFKB 1 [Takifugu rubripes]
MDPGGKPSTAQMLVLASSSALTALFYSIYRKRATTVARLKEAKKVSIDQDLKALLCEAPGRCVPYAVVEGVVRSVKETLNSQFVENCRGVVERLTLKEEKMVWNRTTHIWNSTEKIIHQRTNTVPFVLASHDDDVTASVRVLRPLEASELDLETTYENFHPSAQSLSSAIGHFLSGERPKGIHETEEMLRVGDSVTGVGELVLDNNLVKLQPPKQGLCYFLTRLDYDGLLRKQSGSLRLWQVLTALVGVAACSTLLYILWRRYRHHRRSRKERLLLEAFARQQRRRLRELDVDESRLAPNICSICLSRPRSCVFLECGHVCACVQCCDALPAPKLCPICRAPIDRVVTLYNS